MRYRSRSVVLFALVFVQVTALIGFAPDAMAQRRRFGVTNSQVDQLLRRVDTRWSSFRQTLNLAMDRTSDDLSRQYNLSAAVSGFDATLNSLRDKFSSHRETSSDVAALLNNAGTIDRVMRNRRLSSAAEQDWNLLRSDLELLASYYNINRDWQSRSTGSIPNRTNQDFLSNRLTGTYRLSASSSEDASTVADRATQGLPDQQRQRLQNVIIRRLQNPETLAIETTGRRITIVSSSAPPVTFDADGRERVEQNERGRTIRVRTSLIRNELTVSTVGDRGNDYTVTFSPTDNGQRLRVTRRLSLDILNRPVTAYSTYEKASNVADLNIYTGRPSGGIGQTRDRPIPDGAVINTVLENPLSTRDTRQGDRFTLRVQSPSEYAGSTIEGYVSKLNRSGRLSGRAELGFRLETIRFRDGRTFPFDGTIESVRTPNGDDVRIDTEGRVRDDNQTNRTLGRSGIGAALGAIIGALAGGGKGAAIGAVVGAGAGAGSIYVQGREDLELPQGTDLTIRASAPADGEARRN